MARNEEISQSFDLQVLKGRVLALEAALASGESVSEHLATARSRWAAAAGRGDKGLFLRVFLWCAVTLSVSTRGFLSLEAVLIEQWENPSNWYLQQFRPTSAWAWMRCQELTSSPWLVAVPLLLLVLAWGIQQSCSRRHARVFLLGFAVVESLALLILIVLICQLLIGPLHTLRPRG